MVYRTWRFSAQYVLSIKSTSTFATASESNLYSECNVGMPSRIRMRRAGFRCLPAPRRDSSFMISSSMMTCQHKGISDQRSVWLNKAKYFWQGVTKKLLSGAIPRAPSQLESVGGHFLRTPPFFKRARYKGTGEGVNLDGQLL